MLCSIAENSVQVVPYFDEPVGRLKIQTTRKNSQRYYTTKRLIRGLLLKTPFFFRQFRSDSSLARCEKTCLTGPLEYKYRVIFVLVFSARYLYSTKCSWIIRQTITMEWWCIKTGENFSLQMQNESRFCYFSTISLGFFYFRLHHR